MVENELDRTSPQIKGLLDALYADFTGQIASALPEDQKYSAAMMRRSLEILAAYLQLGNREQGGDRFKLSGQPISRSRLAKALRDRQDIGASHEKLREDLKSDVMHRLWQANPKTLSKPD